MMMNFDYVAGFFDGEGSVSTMNFTWRQGLANTVVCISQTGSEGLAVLTNMRDFLWSHGIKGYVSTQRRRQHYRQMHNYKVCSRESVVAFLREMLPRVTVKKVVVQDTLRFFAIYPSLRGPVTAERNRGKYGAAGLDVVGLHAKRAAGATLEALAAEYGVCRDTIRKYLDPAYRKRYDDWRKGWRVRRIAKAKAAEAAA